MGNNTKSNNMICKIIGGYKKRQNLILGLLIAIFWLMLFMNTISITKMYPNETIKDFSIMRPVSIPTNYDARTVLKLTEAEIGDAYSFDHLFNNVFALFVLGIVSIFMCFKKFNKGLLSKLVTFGYSAFALYSIMFTTNMAHILKTHDTAYTFKLVLVILMLLISLGGIIFVIVDLAKNKWLKFVNIHIFLNSICSLLMLATLGIMFIPFKFGEHTASIMGYLLLPKNYKSGFGSEFAASIPDFSINDVIMIPLLILVLGMMVSIFNAGYHKNMVTPILSIVWGVLCIVGALVNPLIVLDSKFIIYIVLSAIVVLAAAFNLYQHYKANEIYRK